MDTGGQIIAPLDVDTLVERFRPSRWQALHGVIKQLARGHGLRWCQCIAGWLQSQRRLRLAGAGEQA